MQLRRVAFPNNFALPLLKRFHLFNFALSVFAEGVVVRNVKGGCAAAGVSLQAKGQKERSRGPQQGALQDAARHLHGDQGEGGREGG